MVWPLDISQPGPQGGPQLTMGSFHHPIALGVVGRVVYELYSQQLVQACPKD